MKLLAVRRLLRIQRVVIRYQLYDLLFALPLPFWARLLRYVLPGRWLPRRDLLLSRGTRLRLALEELGPIFVKFGQVLSTRRDLLPLDIADELAKLQDQVPPFVSELAVAEIEKSLGKKVEALFKTFERDPIASASIAQVHFAMLHDGREVAVKVLRPGIEAVIAKDVALLATAAAFAERLWADGRRL